MTTRPESDTLVELQEQARDAEQSGNTHAAQQIWLAILQIDPTLEEARAELDRLASAGSVPAPAPAPAPAVPEPPAAHTSAPAPAPSERPDGGGLDLQLDLDAVPDSPAPPPGPPVFDAPPPIDPATEAPSAGPVFGDEAQPSVADLLGAADEVSSEISGQQGSVEDEPQPETDDAMGTPLENLLTNATPPDDLAPSQSVDPQAADYIAQARAALDAGDPSLAVQFAAQAMAIQDDLPEATEISEAARAESTRRAEAAEMRMTEAIAEMDAGRPAQALPLLQQALEAVPGHPEATEYLERCRALAGDDAPGDAGSCGLDTIAPDGLPSIPISGPVAAPASAAPSSEPGSADLSTGPTGAAPPPPLPEFDVSTGPTGAAPPPPIPDLSDLGDPLTGDATGAPLPPPMPEAPAAPFANAAGPAGGAPEPAADLPAAPALPGVKGLRGKTSKRGKGVAVGGTTRVAILAVLIVALGAGGFFVAKMLGFVGGREEVAIPAATTRTATVPSAEKAAASQADRAAAGADAEGTGADTEPGSSQASSDAAPAPKLVVAPGEVPRIRDDARAALASGREERAVELLTAAVAAVPGDFQLARELQDARNALAERQESALAIDKGRRAFGEGNYEDALRVFYRIPAAYRPEGIDRWIGAGWYNLGVRALQNEQIPEARRFFADCLEMLPDDAEAKAHLEVSRRYSRRSVDEAYRMYVRSLNTRPLPSR